MSDEPFLSRWSRRKREVASEQAQPLPHDAAAKPPEPAAEKPPFDPASLPPLESITELTDIKAFLREGVPADLTRAALRRVWTANPAIRDFVGLAENAWDFTDPTAIPGFGPLEDTAEVRAMIARVVGEIGQSTQPGPPDAAEARTQEVKNSNYSNAIEEESKQPAAVAEEQPKQISAQDLGSDLGDAVLLHSNKEDIAPQHDLAEAEEKPKQMTHRIHGGALPR